MSVICKLSDRGRLFGATALLLVAGALAAAPAFAEFGVTRFDGIATSVDATAVTQAGSHPDVFTTGFDFKLSGPIGAQRVDESLKDVTVTLPPGIIGDPTAVQQCENEELQSNYGLLCPTATQVGIAWVPLVRQGVLLGMFPFPLFNMHPPQGVPAQFAFDLSGQVIRLNARLRSGSDYGIDVDVRAAGQTLGLAGSRVDLWGVPSDPSHDAQRHCSPNPSPCASSASRRAFLSLPTSCAGPQTTTLRLNTWQNPDVFYTASFVSHDEHGQPVGTTGCDRLAFDPTLKLTPTTTAASAPTGLAVDLTIPQSDSPTGLATAQLKKAVVTLPPGVAVNPSSADGLAACTPAQADLTGHDPARCPDAAKIGSVRIDTPLVDHPIAGGVYLAQQHNNPFNSLLAMYIAVDDPETGTVIKLPGLIEADPVTGQLKVTIDNSPQLPFDRFHMEFKTGPRAALSNPSTCGTYTTRAELTSWASTTPVSSDSSTTIDQGCDRASKFEPTFAGSSTKPIAAASSSFVMDVGRPDGQQLLRTIETRLPTGLLGMVGQVPLCPEAQAAAGTCDAVSRVGSVQVAAGTGPNPVWLPQAGKAPTAVYLAGPYKGAPYSLSVVVPAQAGPFDLGTVVVRAGLFVDPLDAHVTAKADPLPTILQGIPLQVQKVRVNLDRPGFVVNPSSCAEKQIAGTLTSDQDATVTVGSRFQVGECAALRFAPRLDLALTGKGQTTDGKHPGVVAVLKQRLGEANLKKVSVTLPLSLALDPDNATALCEFTDGSKVTPTCPAGSVVGQARASTPILGQPLSGPVYFVKNVRVDPKTKREIRTLPKLVIPLTGENGIKLTLTGTSAVVDDQLVTTFDAIPDAPVDDFRLEIAGGKHGILAISDANLCTATQTAAADIDAQNNMAGDQMIAMATSACALKVISKTVTGSAVRVKVGGLGAGKVTVSGARIKTTSRTLASSTVATVTAPLTKAGKKHRPTKVKVTFKAITAKKSVATTATLSTKK